MFRKFKKYLFALSLFTLLMISACGSLNSSENITEIKWMWAGSTETSPAFQSAVPNPERYTLTLNPDGSVSIQADCNSVSGTYTLTGNLLTIQLGASTLAYCGEDSLDSTFLASLSSIQSYKIENGQLILMNETTQMQFIK